MPDKPFNKLSDIDKRLRVLFNSTYGGTICNIRMFSGFEIFNTRPYHNYEDWAEGYEITTDERHGNIKVQAEDLDDAITLLEIEVKKFREKKE